jgi:hypothetical protein
MFKRAPDVLFEGLETSPGALSSFMKTIVIFFNFAHKKPGSAPISLTMQTTIFFLLQILRHDMHTSQVTTRSK